MVGDPGIEPGVRLREGVTVPCHTLRPVAHLNSGIDTRVRKKLHEVQKGYDLENQTSTKKMPSL